MSVVYSEVWIKGLDQSVQLMGVFFRHISRSLSVVFLVVQLSVGFLAVICSVLYDNGFSFVCRLDANVVIGLERTNGITLCLGDVLRSLMSASNESGDLTEVYKIMDKVNGRCLFPQVGDFKSKGQIFK
eukprot:g20189.t1